MDSGHRRPRFDLSLFSPLMLATQDLASKALGRQLGFACFLPSSAPAPHFQACTCDLTITWHLDCATSPSLMGLSILRQGCRLGVDPVVLRQ